MPIRFILGLMVAGGIAQGQEGPQPPTPQPPETQIYENLKLPETRLDTVVSPTVADENFLRTAIHRNADMMQVAQLAEDRADSARIKRLAGQILADGAKVDAQLREFA